MTAPEMVSRVTSILTALGSIAFGALLALLFVAWRERHDKRVAKAIEDIRQCNTRLEEHRLRLGVLESEVLNLVREKGRQRATLMSMLLAVRKIESHLGLKPTEWVNSIDKPPPNPEAPS